MQGGPWGVNVIRCADCEVEVKEAASLLIGALDVAAIPVLPLDADPVRGDRAPVFRIPLEDSPFPVNVICTPAEALPELAADTGQSLFAGRYSIGLWLWASGRLSHRLAGAFSLVDEVWAPSAHVAQALAPVTAVPVSMIRLPVDPPRPKSSSRARLGLPDDGFLFVCSVDYLGGFERKNPLAVIEAFSRAFGDHDDVHLAIHCRNHERDLGSHRELHAAAEGNPAIHVLDDLEQEVSPSTLANLCDCFVSLHRAEAFGLELATAMWLGKPAVATGYSGNLDFMNAENSVLVDYKLVPMPGDADGGGEWAEPSVEHAAHAMRQLFEDPGSAQRLGARAAQDIRRTHSPEAAGEIIARRLESIRATGRPRVSASRFRDRPPALGRLPLQLRRGSTPPRRTSGPWLLARRLILRSIRPFTTYQNAVNSELLSALNELSDQVAELRHEIGSDRAQLLAELRRYERRSEAADDR
jgi:glycosyltransferase involved in cell wall biosynthesis